MGTEFSHLADRSIHVLSDFLAEIGIKLLWAEELKAYKLFSISNNIDLETELKVEQLEDRVRFSLYGNQMTLVRGNILFTDLTDDDLAEDLANKIYEKIYGYLADLSPIE